MKRTISRKRHRLHNKKTDWNKAISLWEKQLPILNELLSSGEVLEVIYSSFVGTITSVWEEASNLVRFITNKGLFKHKHKKQRFPCSWWDDECDELIRNRQEALAKFTTLLTRETFLEYKRKEAIARIGLRNVRKKKFVAFCETLNRESNPNYVWNKIKLFKIGSTSQSQVTNTTMILQG